MATMSARATTIVPIRGFAVGTSPPTRDAPHRYNYQNWMAEGRLPSADQRENRIDDLWFGDLLEPLGEAPIASVFLAYGGNFPDALVAVAAGASTHGPVLLVTHTMGSLRRRSENSTS